MRLSFVLINYKVGAQLLECLQSLEAIQNEVECEFVVVDNSPPNASQWLSDTGIRNLRVISNSQNLGYAAACNVGARASRAPYVWFLNPDVRYVEGSARRLLDWLDRNPSVSLAGPRILNSDGTRQYSCRSFPTWTTALAHRHSVLTRMFPSNPLTKNYLRLNLNGVVTEVDWASGCCLVVRKEMFEAIEGFDEGYFLFYEDVDLAHRVKQTGSQCVYYPTVTFTHTIGSSRVFLPDEGIRARHLSAQRYFTKNVIRNPALARICSMAISLRGILSEQYHRHMSGRHMSGRHTLGRTVTPTPGEYPTPANCEQGLT